MKKTLGTNSLSLLRSSGSGEGVNKSSNNNLNLQRISIPNISGNTDSLSLMSHLPLALPQSSILTKNGLEVTTGTTENNMKVATKLIANFFSPVRALASKPVFNIITDNISNNTEEFSLNYNTLPEESTNSIFTLAGRKDDNLKIVINLFYYITNKNQALSDSTINSLGSVLTKLFGYPVELRLVRLHYPYLNSHILAQYVAINTKKYNFTRIQRAIFGALLLPRPKSIASSHLLMLSEGNGTTSLLTTRSLPSHITGIIIRISGRLVTQRSIPRQTVQTAHIGTFSHSKGIKNVVESASLTCKNKKGAFTVKVWISQLPSLQ